MRTFVEAGVADPRGGDAADFAPLLAAARGGAGDARGRLLGRYARYLALLASLQVGRRLQGKADPDDLVQDTFLEAHRHFGLFRGATEAEFVGWLRQIFAARLTNLLRHYLGTKGRDVRLERGLDGGPGTPSGAAWEDLAAPHSTPSQQAARSEEAERLADALGRLPADYRDVVLFRHLEGLPFADVAGRMGRSVDAVQKLWVRALARLGRTLGGPA